MNLPQSRSVLKPMPTSMTYDARLRLVKTLETMCELKLLDFKPSISSWFRRSLPWTLSSEIESLKGSPGINASYIALGLRDNTSFVLVRAAQSKGRS